MRFHIPDTYEKLKEESLPDIHAEGILLRHKKSGAHIALIPCGDPNRVFYIAFRTPPYDAKGAAHIVEHTVLCGSRKYPVKDPFSELVKNSFNTYLNATTYQDCTMYPVASTNAAEFNNLTDVYLDAVFYPRIAEEKNLFLQEGWRAELREDGRGLRLNGVVYQEMRGAYSSPDEVLSAAVSRTLFPDTPYRFDAGGDPDLIPDLTYEEFLSFYAKYYHPSNSLIYFYGDLDMEERLLSLDREYLSKRENRPGMVFPVYQKSLPARTVFSIPYAAQEDENDGKGAWLSLHSVIGCWKDLRSVLAYDVLDYVLLSRSGAPLREALQKEGIGDDISGDLSDGIPQPYYSIVAKGAAPGDLNRFLSVTEREIRKIVSEGIDRNSILASIRRMDFSFREADYGPFPKGLIYGRDMMDSWLYDASRPFDALHTLEDLSDLEEKAYSGGYYEDLLRKGFLGNPHSAAIELDPDPALADKRARENEEKLDRIFCSLSGPQLERIRAEGESLRVFRETPDSREDLACLPRISRGQLDRSASRIGNEVLSEGNVRIVHHPAETGVVYADLMFDVSDLSENELFTAFRVKGFFGKVNAGGIPYTELRDRINLCSGGIRFSWETLQGEDGEIRFYFSARIKALPKDLPEAFRLTGTILTGSDFTDAERIGRLLAQEREAGRNFYANAESLSAFSYAESGLTPFGCCMSRTGGMASYRGLERLLEGGTEKDDGWIGSLPLIARKMTGKKRLIVSVTSDAAGLASVIPAIRELSTVLPESGPVLSPADLSFFRKDRRTAALVTRGMVHHVALAGVMPKELRKRRGDLLVFRHILDSTYLWDRVRIGGNAYGCGSLFRREGTAVFFSYRDPLLAETIRVFREIPDFAEHFEADASEMDGLIIGTAAQMDVPQTPFVYGKMSMLCHLTGVTQEMLQETRDQVLSATASSIRSLSAGLRETLADSRICVAGPEEMLSANEGLFEVVERF